MFDLGASELLLIVIVAVIVIGPKDLPLAMRTAGRWVGKVRRVSSHFRSGIDAMIREAELEEMEKKWKAQNEAIMKANPDADSAALPEAGNGSAESAAEPRPASKAEALSQQAAATEKPSGKAVPDEGKARDNSAAEPQLPLPPP